jgi:hypothetical protein
MSIPSTGGGRRWGRIPQAVAHSGLSRSSLYVLARAHPGLFKKYGDATIVDLPFLDQILEDAPNAKLKSPDGA